MSVKRDKLIAFCNEYLKVKDFEDGCHNGLQVEGRGDIKKIVTGVSLSQKLIEEALACKADMLLVHHGFFANDIPSPLCLDGYRRERLKLLLVNDLSLAGYHLPLDAHPLIGNNISLIKKLGVAKIKPLDLGFIGELPQGIDFDKFRKRVEEQICTHTIALAAGKKKVKKIAVISGSASPRFELAAAAGADVYISGDIREEVVRKIEEVGINFINAGHYNTEKDGIRNLGQVLAKKFAISSEFVDVPNEI